MLLQRGRNLMKQDTSKDILRTFHSFQNRSGLQTSRDISLSTPSQQYARIQERICDLDFKTLHLKAEGKKGVFISGL